MQHKTAPAWYELYYKDFYIFTNEPELTESLKEYIKITNKCQLNVIVFNVFCHPEALVWEIP